MTFTVHADAGAGWTAEMGAGGEAAPNGETCVSRGKERACCAGRTSSPVQLNSWEVRWGGNHPRLPIPQSSLLLPYLFAEELISQSIG